MNAMQPLLRSWIVKAYESGRTDVNAAAGLTWPLSAMQP
jgi:hypothetical protein